MLKNEIKSANSTWICCKKCFKNKIFNKYYQYGFQISKLEHDLFDLLFEKIIINLKFKSHEEIFLNKFIDSYLHIIIDV